MDKQKGRIAVLLIMSVILVSGCTGKRTSWNGTTIGTKKASESPEISVKYDASMLAVIKSVDVNAGIVMLENTETGELYTLTYTGATQIYDKYSQPMSMTQVEQGDLVKAYYLKKKVSLTGIRYVKETWMQKECKDWKIDQEKHMIQIGDMKYYYRDGLSMISGGKDIDFMELNEKDTLSFFGKDKMVLSVRVDKGHGYIRPTGVSEFLGGWIEIGRVIKPVSDGMLIVVPEGLYDVKIAKDGFGGKLSASVERDKEVTLDFADLGSKVVQYGTVEFSITPDDAKLTIAGKEVDYSTQVLLEYDTYRISLVAEGYDDFSGTLKVDDTLEKVKIKMTKSTGTSASPKPSASPTPVPTPTVTPQIATVTPYPTNAAQITSNLYKIIVNGPDGAFVYFDDVYVGTVPASFAKTTGTHTLTLSKPGFTTKSYSIQVTSDQTDVTYALPDLAAEQ